MEAFNTQRQLQSSSDDSNTNHKLEQEKVDFERKSQKNAIDIHEEAAIDQYEEEKEENFEKEEKFENAINVDDALDDSIDIESFEDNLENQSSVQKIRSILSPLHSQLSGLLVSIKRNELILIFF